LRKLKRILLIALASFAALYAGDYLSLRFRIPSHRAQYGTVEVQRYYEVALKNRQTEYLFEDPKPRQCVYSLFPYFGCSPCWWLERHTKEVVKVDPGRRQDFWKIP
jgi:hypothetical protein